MKNNHFRENILVSIITPSFNQDIYLEKNLISVMKQSWKNIEHLVYDGGSTDNTLEILKNYHDRYNLKWTSAPDRGQSDAINRGFQKANGDIVYWLNSDDVLVKDNAIERVVSLFYKNINIDVLYANRLVIDDNDRLKKFQYTNKFDGKKIRDGIYPIFQENVFFRNYVVKNEALDENLHVVMDTDYWIRLSTKYKFLYANKMFAAFRVHDSNKTVSIKFVDRWNIEKDILLKRYGVKRFIIGIGPQPSRYIHRFKALVNGAYNNYINIPKDFYCLILDKKKLFIKFEIKKFLIYLFNSFRPYTG